MITINEGTRIATVGFPIQILAAEESANGTKRAAEAIVLIVDDYNCVSHIESRRFVLKSEDEQPLPDDLDLPSVLAVAQQYADGTLGSWQWDVYRKIQARVVLRPVQLHEAGERLLYRLWMGRFAHREIKQIRGWTKCEELKTLLDKIVLLPQVK